MSRLAKRAQQRLMKQKRAGLSSQVLITFYRATVESILCLNVTEWSGDPRGLDVVYTHDGATLQRLL